MRTRLTTLHRTQIQRAPVHGQVLNIPLILLKVAFARATSAFSELQPVPSITAKTIMIDLWVPFPATDHGFGRAGSKPCSGSMFNVISGSEAARSRRSMPDGGSRFNVHNVVQTETRSNCSSRSTAALRSKR